MKKRILSSIVEHVLRKKHHRSGWLKWILLGVGLFLVLCMAAAAVVLVLLFNFAGSALNLIPSAYQHTVQLFEQRLGIDEKQIQDLQQTVDGLKKKVDTLLPGETTEAPADSQ